MSWLERYGQAQYLDALHLLDSFRRGRLMFGTFVEQLDRVLDIWNCQPEDWSDPLLNDLADLLRTYSGGHHLDASQLSNNAYSHVQTTVTQLWERMLPLCMQREFSSILSAIDTFDKGRLTIYDLERKIWSSLYDLEDLVATDLYIEVERVAYALEEVEEIIERRDDKLDTEVQGWITETLMELKRLLQFENGLKHDPL